MDQIEVLYNEDMSKYTTVKIGGIASKMFFPKDVEELTSIIKAHPKSKILGGGSNLLIANRRFDDVINLRSFDASIIDLGDGHFIVGAAVRNQKLITQINENGYGGIEYLYSVPGMIGGAIVMNAGSGKDTGKSISDYVIAVNILDKDGTQKKLNAKECNFSHRDSIFRKNLGKFIVTSVEFRFDQIAPEEGKKRRNERIGFCKRTQDNTAPNFGSVFLNFNYKIMRLVQKIGLGNSHEVHFSKKSANWILNSGSSNNFDDAKRLIQKVQRIHKVLRKNCEVEVIMWE